MPRIIIIAIILAIAGYFGYTQYFAKTYISSDTTVKELKVDKGKTLIIKNGAKVTVEGNTAIDGTVQCDGGPLNLVAKGNLIVNNKLDCTKSDQGIVLVAEGKVEFGVNSQVLSGGNIQLVDAANHIAEGEDLEKLFDETAMDTDDGKVRIGPLFSEKEEIIPSIKRIEDLLKDSDIKYEIRQKQGLNLIKEAYAQSGADVIINGDWKIPALPPGVNYMVFMNFPGRSVELNGSMTTPNGRDGRDVTTGCSIDIPYQEQKDEKENDGKENKQKDAARLRIRSGKVIIGTYTLILGDGGQGGNAETDTDCDPGIAIAGTGGKSANLKITAETEIIVKNSFTIIPGKGGKGGMAKAYGKKGEPGDPGKKGGSALAIGGDGGDNIKSLKILGNVKGLDKIFVGPVIGGDGGDATANPSDGGDGNVCDAKGGPPGVGPTEGGWGGLASLELPPQVKRTKGAEAKDEAGTNGKSEVSEAKPGKGGPPCDGEPRGGGEGEPLPSPPTPSPSPTPFPGYKTEAPLPATWEFLRIDKNYEKTNTLKLGDVPIHLIVATNGKPDMTTFLPITIILKVDGRQEYKATISGDPKVVCRGPTGCSTDGPVMKKEWKNKPIELSAYAKDGKILARWTE